MFYDRVFNKNQTMIVLLTIVLVACAPAVAPAPTIVSPTPHPTSTLIPNTVTPSPMPTQPRIPFITPDSVQVERWKDYETALGATYLNGESSVLCEWEILGRSDLELYVWAVCKGTIPFGTTATGRSIFTSSSMPSVIHLELNGIIKSIETPGTGITDYPRMFPSDVQEKFELFRFGLAGEMVEHLEWRQTHPEEPPLIVLSATPIP